MLHTLNRITFFSSANMSDSEASLIQSKEIKGKVDEKNNTFETEAGKIWRRNSKPLNEGGYSQVYLYKNGGSKYAVKRIVNISGGRYLPSSKKRKQL